jgi:hypothetical protein
MRKSRLSAETIFNMWMEATRNNKKIISIARKYRLHPATVGFAIKNLDNHLKANHLPKHITNYSRARKMVLEHDRVELKTATQAQIMEKDPILKLREAFGEFEQKVATFTVEITQKRVRALETRNSELEKENQELKEELEKTKPIIEKAQHSSLVGILRRHFEGK